MKATGKKAALWPTSALALGIVGSLIACLITIAGSESATAQVESATAQAQVQTRAANAKAGKKTKWVGNWNKKSRYRANSIVLYSKTLYIAKKQSKGKWPKKKSPYWMLLSQRIAQSASPGQQGPAGPDGSTGPQGPVGPPGSDGSWRVYDGNNVDLGYFLSGTKNNFVLMTSAGYVVQIDLAGFKSASQVYWTGISCTGTPYLNASTATTGQILAGNYAYYSYQASTYLVADPATVANGYASSVSLTVQTFENIPNGVSGASTCGSASSSNSGWKMVSKSASEIGLPDTIAPGLYMARP